MIIIKRLILGISLLAVFFFFAFSIVSKREILVIGDSISLGYGPELSNLLSASFEYSTKNTNSDAGNLDFPTGPNAGDSRMVLNYLRTLQLDKGLDADLIVLNCGLHDVKVKTGTACHNVSPMQYALNLDTIFSLIHELKQTVVWVNTTPVNDSVHNSKNLGFQRFKRDVELYNQIADSICLKHKVKVIDLYSFSSNFPVEAYADHVHYRSPFANLQAGFLAENIFKLYP